VDVFGDCATADLAQAVGFGEVFDGNDGVRHKQFPANSWKEQMFQL